jgi:hypothetical protein
MEPLANVGPADVVPALDDVDPTSEVAPTPGELGQPGVAAPSAGTISGVGPSGVAAPSNDTISGVVVWPVSIGRITECQKSAEFWAEILPFQADSLQRKADRWSIAAGLLAAIAGLAAWKLVADRSDWWAVALTSGLALSAAACALVPRIKNYGETAGLARELAARYGDANGTLTDVLAWVKAKHAAGATQTPNETAAVLAVVKEFEVIKKSKDGMRYLPLRSETTLDYCRIKRTPLSKRRSLRRTQGTT